MENIVAQDHAYAVAADEGLTDDESLRKTVGRRLLGIGKIDLVVGTVAQKAPKAGQVLRCGDNQNVAYACLHQHGNRIIDHRLVVDGQQLLRYSLGYGI